MSPKKNDPFAEYRQLAEQSRQAWQAMWQQAANAAQGGAFGSASSSGGASVESGFQRMLDGLREYGAWMESMRASSMANPAGLNWAKAAQQSFAGGAPFDFAGSFSDLPQFGATGPDAWMAQMQTMLGSLQPTQAGSFEWPAFGPAREHQERSQQHAKRVAEYMEISGRYQALLARVGGMAAERLQEQLADSDQPGARIESMRGLYDAWIDAAESAYAEVAMSDEFREIYGALLNAQMRVRAGIQEQLQQMAAELGMPTRDEVNSLGKRLQEMRREHRALLAEVEAMRGPAQNASRKSAAAGKPATTRKNAAASGNKAAAKSSRATAKNKTGKSASARKSTRKTTRKD